MRALVSAWVQPGYLDPTWSDSREGVAVAVGFSSDVCLRPNEGRGEVESLGVTTGKGLVAVAVGFSGEVCLEPNEGRVWDRTKEEEKSSHMERQQGRGWWLSQWVSGARLVWD